MPTIAAALTIDSLLPGSTEKVPMKKPLPQEESPALAQMKQSFYNPSLYAVPTPVHIPDHSSIAFSPTTYVINHKRRDAQSGSGDVNRTAEFEVPLGVVDSYGGDGEGLLGMVGGQTDQNTDERLVDLEVVDRQIEKEDHDFLDTLESVTVCTSGSDVEDGHSPRCVWMGKQLSVHSRSQDEYHDAAEEFCSDGSLSSSSPLSKRNYHNEMHTLRISLIEQSNKIKVVESSLLCMTQHWEKLLKCLSQLGLLSSEMQDFGNLENDIDPSALCQEIVVLKFVSEAIATDMAKDEVREAFKETIFAKNHEISRLKHQMLYYEAMNHEMSLRNQEIVDLARKRRKRTRRWIWSFVGLSITVGASLLAYAYLPHSGKEFSSASQATDGSDIPSSHEYCDASD
ncbi:hypothetical protein HPP92_017672 [Vanilla planifolia]|uniref:Uncharacterized protein n=1 Tax=Vanilla planifolia TaxID=51239 RepID=A0A835QEW8_VANPL|nr:hypothetical protein HPP92_017672 [Vanilla planifolia]